jgi:NTP pyrophosphatase (non-canonical NTP hydrolase)
MDFDQYQKLARRTLDSNRTSSNLPKLLMAGLGIAGEAGEVADLLKKHFFHGHQLDRQKLFEEVGDVLWYCAAVATLLEWDFSDVAMGNVAKLEERYPDGFSAEASIARVDVVSRAPDFIATGPSFPLSHGSDE